MVDKHAKELPQYFYSKLQESEQDSFSDQKKLNRNEIRQAKKFSKDEIL